MPGHVGRTTTGLGVNVDWRKNIDKAAFKPEWQKSSRIDDVSKKQIINIVPSLPKTGLSPECFTTWYVWCEYLRGIRGYDPLLTDLHEVAQFFKFNLYQFGHTTPESARDDDVFRDVFLYHPKFHRGYKDVEVMNTRTFEFSRHNTDAQVKRVDHKDYEPQVPWYGKMAGV